MYKNMNTLVEKTWQAMNETLQWPSVGKSNGILTNEAPVYSFKYVEFKRTNYNFRDCY